MPEPERQFITFMTVVEVEQGTDTTSMGAQIRISEADKATHRMVLNECLDSIGVNVLGMETSWADGWRSFFDATSSTKALEFPEVVSFLDELRRLKAQEGNGA